jgi:hypothetical protein
MIDLGDGASSQAPMAMTASARRLGFQPQALAGAVNESTGV